MKFWSERFTFLWSSSHFNWLFETDCNVRQIQTFTRLSFKNHSTVNLSFALVSAIRELWSLVMFWKFSKIARAADEYHLRTIITSRVTRNHEMNKQVHAIFILFIYSTKLLHRFVSIATSVLHSITYLCILHWPLKNALFFRVRSSWPWSIYLWFRDIYIFWVS